MLEKRQIRAGYVADWLRPRRWGALSTVLALAAGLGLRLWMLKQLFQAIGDSLIYGEIARNLLEHGVYGRTGPHGPEPTLIRLPGYPLLLAGCFRLFGMENYWAVLLLQIALELAGCLLLADFARRIAPARLAGRAFQWTLWIAALCPFTASYCASPMAETPTLFCVALALWALACFYACPRWRFALLITLAVTAATLLRPDGALLGVALLPAVAASLVHNKVRWRRAANMSATCLLLALLPFAAWTLRNWRTLHVLQPLAPRLATDPGEDPHMGWERWVKSWCVDFTSTYDIYWYVPGDVLDASKLPARTFDSAEEKAATLALVADYNQHLELTAELDARFGALADARARQHPLRTHVLLPVGRMMDMWLRPRNENLPLDLDWWNYARHRVETRISWVLVGLNAAYLLLALAGLWFRPRLGWALALYMLLRSGLLLTVEAPEARYTLECYPMLMVLAGIALAALFAGRRQAEIR